MKRLWKGLIAALILVFSLSGAALAAELVVNGGFETGDATGWTAVNMGSGGGDFFIMSGTTTPINSFTVLPPPDGTYAAMTDQLGAGTHILYQDIAVPAGGSTQFSATIYLNNQAGAWIIGPGLDSTTTPNQQFRVDIMNPAAAADDVGAGVLMNVYQTQPGDSSTLGYTTISADLSAYAGQTVRIRFAEVDNQFYLNTGVDQVSAISTVAAAVPTMNEWGMIVFMLLAGVGSIFFLKRRQQA